MKTSIRHPRKAAFLPVLLLPCLLTHAQTASSPALPATQAESEETVVLSPFEVSAGKNDGGYSAATTLAGNRLNTDLRDVGSSITVVTGQFLRDTNATNNATLLQRLGGTEVGGANGNFAGSGSTSSLTVLAEDTIRPNENTRIRGLAAADNTRDFFRSEIPWDSYNVDRIDIQRGPNSILFGQGSPAGIINSSSKGASFRNSGELEFRYGSYGSARGSLDWNQVLVDKQVAIRIDALDDHEKFEQKPAYSKDKRIYGAIRIEPDFLNKNGNRTIIKANYENGNIDSNNPRQLPPTDHISPWFTQLNQQGLNGLVAWIPANPSTKTDLVNGVSAARPNFDPNKPAYEPNFTNGQFLNDEYPLTVFQSGAANGPAGTYRFPYLDQNHGADHGVSFPYGAFPGSWVGLGGTASSAVFGVLPYANGGAFKDASITDPSIFNFYKNLIDGDTKKEWQRFWSGSVNLTQTFAHDQVGFSLDFYKEHYESGQMNMLGGAVPLYVDVMSTNNDGQSQATASKNPGFGTPFVVSNRFSNNSWESNRENKRATAFVTRDFRKDIPGMLGEIIGTHTLTGLLGDDSQKTDSMSWQRYGYIGTQTAAANALYSYNGNFQQAAPTQVVYLGNSLLGKSLSGVNIPRITGNPTVGSNPISYFDFTPDPAGAAFPDSDPRHYVGWAGQKTLTVYDTEADGNDRRTLAYYSGLRKQTTSSQALVWQGKLLDGALVGTYGWRRDVNKSYSADINLSNPSYVQNGLLNFDTLKLPSVAGGRIAVQSRSYSIVAHLGDLPGIKEVAKNLPVNVSLSYNVSTNFEPDSSRVNINGDRIAAPAGKTIDKGILIETRDGKYSLKVNRYVTTVTNGTNPNSATFASELNSFVGNTAFFNNRFYYHNDNGSAVANATNPGIGDGSAAAPAGANTGNAPAGYFFDNNGFHTQAMEDLQNASTASVRDWENKIAAAYPNFWKLWGYNSLADVQAGRLASSQLQGAQPLSGFAIIENAVSKGWEVELNANPIRNWRITLNATRTDAVRTSVGDPALAAFMQATTDMVSGAGGSQHWYWGTADVPSVLQTYYIKYGAGTAVGTYYYGLKSMENVAVPELAKWRLNLNQNYDFSQGMLKGFNVGGGLRYQSSTVIGYPPGGDPSGPPPYSPDLSKPYHSPNELYIDLWVGYRHKVTNKINWNIQLNVQNVGKGDKLLPVSLQGPINGVATPATYRIAPSQIITLTNRFEF